jgi:hypothetical protein
MLVYHAVAAGLHHQMLFVKARLEALVVVVLLWLYGHRVLGYCLGWFLRYKLDPTSSGKFAFHIDWIALRLGLDQNMVVVSGFEWRNPVVFKNTPYLLRIGEISVVVDAMSLYGAIMKNAPIKVKEIRVNRVTLYLEKLTAGGTAVKEEERLGATAVATAQSTDGNATVAVVESVAVKAPEEVPTTPTAPRTAGRAERARSAQRDSAGTNANCLFAGPVRLQNSVSYQLYTLSLLPVEKRTTPAQPTALKPGVLNLWAAMGATDAQQEASILSDVSGQMDSANDGEKSSVVGAMGAAVAKPATMLLKGGKTVGSALGNTLGAGVELLRSRSGRNMKITQADLESDGDDDDDFADGGEATVNGHGKLFPTC